MKELFNIRSKISLNKAENDEKIEEFIYNLLHQVDILDCNTDDTRETYKVWVGENEFTITQHSGHMDFCEIEHINSLCKPSGYQLFGISDTKPRGQETGIV